MFLFIETERSISANVHACVLYTRVGLPRVDDAIVINIKEGDVLLKNTKSVILVARGSVRMFPVWCLQCSWHI